MIATITTLKAPDRAGIWLYYPEGCSTAKRYVVEETCTGGRFCRALKMGGSSSRFVGYSPWSGSWIYADSP